LRGERRKAETEAEAKAEKKEKGKRGEGASVNKVGVPEELNIYRIKEPCFIPRR
jgi:hypothetical protein